MVQIRNEKGQFVAGNKNENIVGRNEKGQFVNKPVQTIQTIVLPVEQTKQNTESDKMVEPKTNSRSNVIREALLQGSENIDGIVDLVIAARPNDDPVKVMNQIKAGVRKVKAKESYWANYKLVDEVGTFKIVPITI